MIANRRKQKGAGIVTWMIFAGFALFVTSTVVKIAPYYVEFNNIKTLMTGVAGETGIHNVGKKEINIKIGKYLNINGISSLEKANKARSRSLSKKTSGPFKVKTIKKGKFKGKRILSVDYSVPQPWVGNVTFMLSFNHAVILGEPETAVKLKQKKFSGY